MLAKFIDLICNLTLIFIAALWSCGQLVLRVMAGGTVGWDVQFVENLEKIWKISNFEIFFLNLCLKEKVLKL